ncbi:hypothetical protein KDM89_11330 [Undibacterium sp. LFS511W]|uniref:Uncharacterized protein n=1 Tax=Undibacterium luofuense TaxID=2828733 RepID=A0A941DNE2_9BURK|nr:hypothetical protein [Undibacterium luofuense]
MFDLLLKVLMPCLISVERGADVIGMLFAIVRWRCTGLPVWRSVFVWPFV